MRLVNSFGSEDTYECPFCDDTSGHLSVNKIKGVYHCFKCNKSGRIDQLEKISNTFINSAPRLDSLIESLNSLFTHNSLYLPRDYKLVEENTEAFEYLNSRGIDLNLIQYYNIGCSNVDNHTRVWFPDYDKDKNLCFYSSRLYKKNIAGMRWMFPSSKRDGVYKSNQLYDYNRANSYSRLVVVEGITSKISVGKNATATYGTGWSQIQLHKLADSSAKEIVILFDGDTGFDPERKKICEQNGIDYTSPKKGREKGLELSLSLAKLRRGIKLAEIPMGKDPGDYINDHHSLQNIIENAIRVKSPIFYS